MSNTTERIASEPARGNHDFPVRDVCPMVADVVSGRLPKPREWTRRLKAATWWQAAPLRRFHTGPGDGLTIAQRDPGAPAFLPLRVTVDGMVYFANEDGTRYAGPFAPIIDDGPRPVLADGWRLERRQGRLRLVAPDGREYGPADVLPVIAGRPEATGTRAWIELACAVIDAGPARKDLQDLLVEFLKQLPRLSFIAGKGEPRREHLG